MTITRSEHDIGTGDRSAIGWTGLGRAGAAAALAGGGVLWSVADLIGFGHDGVRRAAYISAHPALTAIGVTADMLGTALLMVAVPIWLLLGRVRSPRLAWAGAVLGVFGMVAQAVIHGVDLTDYQVARAGTLDYASYQKVLDAGTSLPLVVFMVMFLAGAFLGTALAMIALWRSRTVPRPAILLWAAFLAVNLASVPMPTTVLALAALVWMAVAIVRTGRTTLP